MTALPAAFLSAPIAHRGLHDRAAGIVENTISAARAAIEDGYGIELDLQLSADGEAMVFHDDDLARLTGRDGPVGALTAAELTATPLLDAARSEAPPSFSTLLQAAAGRAPLLIEIKRQPDDAATRALTARAVAALNDYSGPAALMSFDPVAVAAAALAAPDVPRGLVSMDYARADVEDRVPEARRADLTDMADLERLDCAFASYHWRDLPMPRTQTLREAGLPLLCWTTRSLQDDASARRHADNVTFEGYRPPR
ncbi:MAG: glycerophosphodiester phosphodiesterase family protein [Pseudomonadota bacterium]